METHFLFHLLHQKVRHLSKELNKVLEQHQLYNSQWTILYTLSQKGPMSQTQIWQYLDVEAPTVTRTLARMEKSGWVQRVPGKDKRERIVVLTDRAQQELPDIQQTIQQYEASYVASLSESEQQQLYHLLNKLGDKKER
ncbi:DNA-binding transcriptional regulator, MarR family [Alteribacillus persepolensis]|uniref:DNA-binding transcriptional regulator, MarR family n=1 Tax=Alteribacillus persepolensis TaxID=568899 RepID=A0A1G7Y7Z2_9BACI|nr:MarR family transcriptional regulator [Alteribacillus persepolensis]SDG92561.1 DNA-binding transcriptional regulator, MarR family [Alteribacillus persepolensis]